jgi:hypothetical protein
VAEREAHEIAHSVLVTGGVSERDALCHHGLGCTERDREDQGEREQRGELTEPGRLQDPAESQVRRVVEHVRDLDEHDHRDRARPREREQAAAHFELCGSGIGMRRGCFRRRLGCVVGAHAVGVTAHVRTSVRIERLASIAMQGHPDPDRITRSL